ncbi:MAG TPA: hypothetical protein DCF33_09835 [Saprospirales bacterium]|nr:hypothetical protein [Saprospirales bacterium]
MEDIELIEQYLRGELTPEAHQQFENRLATDQNLRQETELHRYAIYVVRQEARNELKAALKSRLSPGTFQPKRSFRWLLWTLGILVVAAGVVFWKFQYHQKNDVEPSQQLLLPDTTHRAESPEIPVQGAPSMPSPATNPDIQRIYAANFSPYTSNELQTLARAASDDDPFTQFVQAYLNRDFKNALKKFEMLSDEDKTNENILFLRANALLATNQASAAIPILDKICSDKTSTYLPDAQWYAGLAYLKANDLKRAKSYFKEIAASSRGKHPYAEKATKLLNTDLHK